MKKTIAILLVLVIGMAGVFAADALATTADNAEITIATTVLSFAYFGLAAPDTTSVDFTSGDAFLEDIADLIEYTSADYDLTDFSTAQSLATLWGINNTTNAISLSLTVADGGFKGADGTTIIPLTVSLTNKTITAASGTTLGKLDSGNIITAVATDTTQVYTAIAQDYSTTITISVTTEA